MKSTNAITIYTDGACSNNGKKNAVAGIGVYFGENDNRNLSQKLNSSLKQTNNVAELTAILKAYEIIQSQNYDIINIYTDSEYALKCCTYYAKKIIDGNKINAPNYELLKKTYETFKDKKNINFLYVRGHTENNDIHSIGNKYADKLATLAIM
jgi:ribonuclease HI